MRFPATGYRLTRRASSFMTTSSVAPVVSGAVREHPEHCAVCGSPGAFDLRRAPDRFHGGTTMYVLRRCPACTLVWLEDPPSPAEMGRHYGPAYDRFIQRAGESSPGRWTARKSAIYGHRRGGRLLDLGCSSGAFLESLKGDGWELHGIEMSEAVAKRAEARSGAQVFVGDILDAPFASGTFDVVTSFDVLEHVYQPRDVLKKVVEWLKPGGFYYVLVPNIDSGEARLFQSYWYGLELPRHLSHFSPQSLRYLALSVGLEEIFVETNRNSALEHSLRYLGDTLLQRLGMPRKPLAEAGPAGLPWKVIRKLLRWTAFPLLYRTSALWGSGESIHAMFKKPSDQRLPAAVRDGRG